MITYYYHCGKQSVLKTKFKKRELFDLDLDYDWEYSSFWSLGALCSPVIDISTKVYTVIQCFQTKTISHSAKWHNESFTFRKNTYYRTFGCNHLCMTVYNLYHIYPPKCCSWSRHWYTRVLMIMVRHINGSALPAIYPWNRCLVASLGKTQQRRALIFSL